MTQQRRDLFDLERELAELRELPRDDVDTICVRLSQMAELLLNEEREPEAAAVFIRLARIGWAAIGVGEPMGGTSN